MPFTRYTCEDELISQLVEQKSNFIMLSIDIHSLAAKMDLLKICLESLKKKWHRTISALLSRMLFY